MAGKGKHIEPKITKKKNPPSMKKRNRKIDLREEIEKTKGLSAIIAEQGAVQVELIEHINTLLLQPFDWDTHSNLHLTLDQLRSVNFQAKQLDAAIRDYTDEMLAVFLADEFKGK